MDFPRVGQIHETDGINNIQSDRTISLLNNFAKILEIIMHATICESLRTVISSSQNGF